MKWKQVSINGERKVEKMKEKKMLCNERMKKSPENPALATSRINPLISAAQI